MTFNSIIPTIEGWFNHLQGLINSSNWLELLKIAIIAFLAMAILFILFKVLSSLAKYITSLTKFMLLGVELSILVLLILLITQEIIH